ncbi:MAG: hypothetical protein C4K58_01895 [Flavobacteriaceae bacterium]|nr:MAG: hypothetical protein C4K58_01895 [Flavobacteriaceae bacterium]
MSAAVTVISNGMYFDGTGKKGSIQNVLIKNGKVEKVSSNPIQVEGATEIDATGKWVMPGMIDIHTHYDAEIEVMPGIEESLRHGVTTCIMGNCSLSAAIGKDTDIVDLFCRVENIPAQSLKDWLVNNISWKSVTEYYQHLDTLNLGPNIATFLGHSNVRIEAMGLKRSLTERKASKEEINKMKAIVSEAVDAGFLGLSIDMLPFHRMSGVFSSEFTGFTVPSQVAAVSEYKQLSEILRERDKVLQITPNAIKKTTILDIFALSSGW